MINLLSLQQKEELKGEENLKLVLVLGIIILAFLVSLILILFAIKTSFSAALNEQKIYVELKEKELKNPAIQELEEKIKKYNLVLSKLETFYKSQPDSTSMLEKIFQAFPEGTYLTSLNFNPQTSQISLDGFSPTREILVQFRENLEKTEGLKGIYFSPANWLEAASINFTVNFRIEQ